MGQSFFRFKSFTVHQDRSALKVSTDSCIFGAWVAQQAQELPLNFVLDIGAGSGLLMLMLAQKIPAAIDGVELDDLSAEQARENIAASPWQQRLQVVTADVQTWTSEQQYDLVVSNPPFYENDLPSPVQRRNQAMHDAGLKLDGLLVAAQRLLRPGGSLAVLLPRKRLEVWVQLSGAAGWQVKWLLEVAPSHAHPVNRVCLWLEQVPVQQQVQRLNIREADGSYTNAFTTLLRDYYLAF